MTHVSRVILVQVAPFFPPIPVDKAALDVAEAPPKSFRHEGVEDRVEDRVEVVENT